MAEKSRPLLTWEEKRAEKGRKRDADIDLDFESKAPEEPPPPPPLPAMAPQKPVHVLAAELLQAELELEEAEKKIAELQDKLDDAPLRTTLLKARKDATDEKLRADEAEKLLHEERQKLGEAIKAKAAVNSGGRRWWIRDAVVFGVTAAVVTLLFFAFKTQPADDSAEVISLKKQVAELTAERDEALAKVGESVIPAPVSAPVVAPQVAPAVVVAPAPQPKPKPAQAVAPAPPAPSGSEGDELARLQRIIDAALGGK